MVFSQALGKKEGKIIRFGIVGPVSKDHIVLPTGEKLEKYGALVYVAAAMARLMEPSHDEIMCVSHVSPADFEAVSVLLRHPNINLSGLFAMTNGTTEIELTYIDERNRLSRQINIMPSITEPEIDMLADCAAVLLMPLNESDIPLAGVRRLRSLSDAVIFLDAHGLVTGVDEDGTRGPKSWQNAAQWYQNLDIVKMNEQEACRVAGRPIKGYSDFARFAAGLLAAGPQTCWITFGDQSSLLAWRRDDHVQWACVPVVRDIGPVTDTTGCGDASSAGFVHAYVKGYRNPLRAVILGNTMGSLKATFAETDAFPSRPEISGVIGGHYREYLHSLLDDLLSQSRVIVHEIEGGRDVESFMYRPDGSHGPWADHARDSDSPGTAT